MEIVTPQMLIGCLIAIIGWFLIQTMLDLKETKKMTIENKNKIDLMENNHNHLATKLDRLCDDVKDLTSEIKQLMIELAKKK